MDHPHDIVPFLQEILEGKNTSQGRVDTFLLDYDRVILDLFGKRSASEVVRRVRVAFLEYCNQEPPKQSEIRCSSGVSNDPRNLPESDDPYIPLKWLKKYRYTVDWGHFDRFIIVYTKLLETEEVEAAKIAPLTPGIEDLMEVLWATGRKFYIITNNSYTAATQFLYRLDDIRIPIKGIMARDSDPFCNPKPSADMIVHASFDYGFNISKSAFLGDQLTDLYAVTMREQLYDFEKLGFCKPIIPFFGCTWWVEDPVDREQQFMSSGATAVLRSLDPLIEALQP